MIGRLIGPATTTKVTDITPRARRVPPGTGRRATEQHVVVAAALQRASGDDTLIAATATTASTAPTLTGAEQAKHDDQER